MRKKLLFFFNFLLFYGFGSYLIIADQDNFLIDFIFNFTSIFFSENFLENEILKVPIFFSFIVVLYTITIVVFFRSIIFHEFVYDSPYFMGFLFTLTALCYTFYNVNPNIDASPVVVISQSGISLVTSIFGMLGRLFIITLSLAMMTEQMLQDKNTLLELAETQNAMRELAESQNAMRDLVESQNAMREAVIMATEKGIIGGMDEGTRARITSIDRHMLRMVEELAAGRAESTADLRSEIRTLTRTIESAARGELDG